RFRDADMASEAIFAFVNLIGLYHDTILADAAAQQNPESGPNSSSFNRYTRAALRFSTVYKRVAYALTLIQFSEVLAEMGAIKVGGKRAKWKVVVLIEILKVACRLALLKLSKNRMLLHSSVPERDYDMANLKPTDEVQPVTWKGKRTGKEHVSLSVFNPKRSAGGNSTADQAVQYLLSKALVESIRTPLDLVSSLKDLRAVGEYLYVLRPLIYVLALRKFGAKSWKPWTISLIMELCSLASAINPSTGSLRKDVRNVEKDEYRRRMYSFIYYLLRSPFYERFTKYDVVNGFVG
ncbi:Peroxisomal membrane protein pex16, partial [Quaeritorhiza haematococci]